MLAEPAEAKTQVHRRSMRLMGNRFEISVVSADSGLAACCIEAAVGEISRIEKMLTTFSEESETALVNQMAGIAPVTVSEEFFSLVERSQRISRLTQGAFDLSYGSLDKRFWNFDTTMKQLPDKESARKSISKINFKNILLDPQNRTVFLKEKGMRIGFGGIGKGYAADKARLLLQSMGVESGIVNASGDLITWGRQPDGSEWTVGIALPDGSQLPFSQLKISNRAIATSGNYEKFVWIDGKRYSHTIDPRTGFPVHGIRSVSIICPQAELADAMTTPVMIMGVEAGLHLINQLKGMACIIIDENNRLFTSKNIQLT